jgi:uncharacterized protein YndB with AHSA1/START domain
MWKKIALGLAALAVLLLVAISLQPATFAVERSVTIDAPAGLVFGYIQSPRAHEAWSPFFAMDPEQTNRYEGPDAGVGASTAWEGGRAGKGRMTVTDVKPDREVTMRLEFQEPMEATNRAVFRLEPAGGGTTVTWRLDGEQTFVGKAFSLVTDMDAMVGGEFEKGLASLKTLAEQADVAPD